MIEINGLKKSYQQVHALRGVDLKIMPGHVTGLLGPNACGKTTLIKSILGLVLPDAGMIRVQGQDIRGQWDYRQKIGYLPQNPDFPGNLVVGELFEMMEDIRGSDAKYRDELVELFELGPFLKRPLGTLSGGTKQKAGVVLAFMFGPEILILDEPTVGLDPVAVVRLKRLLERFAGQGATILLVSHIMSEVEQLVKEMSFLLDGQVLFSGTLDSIRERMQQPKLEDAIVQWIETERGIRQK